MNKLLKTTNGYKSINSSDNNKINVEQDNNITLDDTDINISDISDNGLYERNSKMKAIFGEKYLW